MDSLILSIILFIVGAISYTGISYTAKYLRDSKTKFNMLYFITALLSIFLCILLTPSFLIPGILPMVVSGPTGIVYILIASFSMGLAANFLLNLPLTFLLKRLAEANVSLTDIKPNSRWVIYAVSIIGLIALISGASVYAVVQYQQSISTSGTIKTVGVNIYSEYGQTVELTTIYWGIQEPGSTTTVRMWVKSTSSTPVTLSFYTSNWVPATAQDYMNLSWDYDGSVIEPDGVKQIVLTLDVSNIISGIVNFSFDITIVAG